MSFHNATPNSFAARWSAIARVPGILFATAALVVGLSGAVALPQLDLPAPLGGPTADNAATEPAPAPAPTAHRTGDSLTADQAAAFEAYAAWLQAQGLHKGHARYVHA